MKLKSRSIILVTLLIALLVGLVILGYLLSITDTFQNGEPSILLTRTAIISQNQTVQVLIYQTKTAAAEGIGDPLPEGYTMSPDTLTVAPTLNQMGTFTLTPTS